MNPEVRQCQDESSPLFGAVALKLPEGSPLGEYGVMTLNRGGHFATAGEVENWAQIQPRPLS